MQTAYQPIQQNDAMPRDISGSKEPTFFYCPNCKDIRQSEIITQCGIYTWLFGLGLTIVACCCLPFIISDCKDKVHVCPRCHAHVGFTKFDPLNK